MLMDEPPHKIIRYLQWGLIDRTLSTSTIWICVGCNTCSTECPMSIDIPLIFDFLKKKSLDMGIKPKEIDVFKFHNEVLNSIKRYGRTHKLGIMFNFKLKSGSWLRDIDVGLRMFYKGKLDIVPHTSSRVDEVKRIFGLHEK